MKFHQNSISKSKFSSKVPKEISYCLLHGEDDRAIAYEEMLKFKDGLLQRGVNG